MNKRSGPEGPPRFAAAKQANTEIIADRQRKADYASLADPRNPVDYARLEADAAALAAELGICRSRSKETSQEQIEREPHNRRSAGCGRVAVLEDSRQPGSLAAARLPCKRKTCPVCGPIWRQAVVGHYLAVIADTPVVRRVVDPRAWRTMAARLRRAGAQHVRLEMPDGTLVIYSTVGGGRPVSDLAGALVADVAVAAGRITASSEWARQPVSQRGPSRWRMVGLASVPLARVVQVARDLNMYVAEVPAHQLPADWAEAHLLRRTDDDLAWRRFRRWVGLHWPERRPASRAA
jgi:hypothetical protein